MVKYISEGHAPGLVISCIVPLILTWLFFAGRIYVRWFMLKLWKIEDWFFVASQKLIPIDLIYRAYAVALVSALHGNGQRLVNIEFKDIPTAMELFLMGAIFYTITTLFIRLSIGFYLLRICLIKVHFRIIKITMAIMTVFTIVYFVFTIVQCSPLSYFWTRFTGGTGSCFDATTVQNATIGYSAFSAATDLIFGILLIFLIWNLKMNRKAKIVVGGLLALGILAGFTVIVRLEYVRIVNHSIDFLFATSNVTIWSMIEPAIGICCMAASTYRPLFASLKDKSTANYASNTKGSGYFPGAGALGSRVHGESNNFRLNRSMRKGNGYLRSTEVRDEETDSFEDVIALESLENTVEGGQKGEGSGHGYGRNSPDEEKGIMFSTTVEIRRDLRKPRADSVV